MTAIIGGVRPIRPAEGVPQGSGAVAPPSPLGLTPAIRHASTRDRGQEEVRGGDEERGSRDTTRRQLEWAGAVRDSNMSLGAKALCWDLLLYFNRECRAWPSQALLSKDLDRSGRQIRTGLSEARDAGFLSTARRGPREMVYAMRFPDDYQGQAAGDTDSWTQAVSLIQKHWWLGKRSPEVGWTMGNERTIWAPFARDYGAEIVNRAIPHVRPIYGMDGKPFTGKLVQSRKGRARWTECLSKAQAELMESAEIENLDR